MWVALWGTMSKLLKKQILDLGIDEKDPDSVANSFQGLLKVIDETYDRCAEKCCDMDAHNILQHMSSIVRAIPCPMLCVSSDLKYTGVNPLFSSLLEEVESEVIGKKVGDIKGDHFLEFLSDFFDSETTLYEWDFDTNKLGEVCAYHMIAQKYNNNQDVLIIGFDVSDRKKREVELREVKRKYDATFEQSAVCILHTHIDFEIISANKNFEDLVTSADLRLPSHLLDIFRDQDKKRLLAWAKGACEMHDGKISFEACIHSETGCHHWVLLSCSFISSYEEEFLMCVLQDITAKKKAEEGLRKSTEALRQADKMRALGQMSNSIAHEINNPLAIIHGRASLAKSMVESGNIKPEKIIKGLDRIIENTDRVAAIVKSLRIFSEDSPGCKFTKCSLQSIVDSLSSVVSTIAERNTVDFKVEGNFKDTFVECDASAIHKLLLNLIMNAIEAAAKSKEKWVKLGFESYEGSLVIKVVDSGAKLSDWKIKKLFEPFYTTKGIGEGMGLGLSVCKGIVRSHNGSLAIDKNAQHTTFTVVLPLLQP